MPGARRRASSASVVEVARIESNFGSHLRSNATDAVANRLSAQARNALSESAKAPMPGRLDIVKIEDHAFRMRADLFDIWSAPKMFDDGGLKLLACQESRNL